MTTDPAIHNRRTIRLKGFDYIQAGAYFITSVTHQREALLSVMVVGGRCRGEASDNRLDLNHGLLMSDASPLRYSLRYQRDSIHGLPDVDYDLGRGEASDNHLDLNHGLLISDASPLRMNGEIET